MGYQWDRAKARANLHKLGVDFGDAVRVFEGNWGLGIEEEHARDEERFATLGADFLGRKLVVLHACQGEDLRLISAREGTKGEQAVYDRKRA